MSFQELAAQRPLAVVSEDFVRNHLSLPLRNPNERFSFGEDYDAAMCQAINRHLEVSGLTQTSTVHFQYIRYSFNFSSPGQHRRFSMLRRRHQRFFRASPSKPLLHFETRDVSGSGAHTLRGESCQDDAAVPVSGVRFTKIPEPHESPLASALPTSAQESSSGLNPHFLHSSIKSCSSHRCSI